MCEFPSRGPYIRDAVDGRYTAYRVGSSDECRFWKIERVGSYEGRKELAKCFYRSPESYETESKCAVSETDKRLWRAARGAHAERAGGAPSLK